MIVMSATLPAFNSPPGTPAISGEAQGRARRTYTYTFTATDPDGDNVYYCVEWGDNTVSGWVDAFPTGQAMVVTHSWPTGNYTIRAKTRDVYGYESDWATLKVTVPYSSELPRFRFFEALFEWFLNAFPLLRHLRE